MGPLSSLSKKIFSLFFAFVIVIAFALAPLPNVDILASTPTFTNNNAPAASPVPGSTNNLIFDITLPASDSDTFLDSDGTLTSGASSAGAISAGDALVELAMPEGEALCGNTDGTTAPTNMVQDMDGYCGSASTITIVDPTDNGTAAYSSMFCVTATDCKIAYQTQVGLDKYLMMADCDNATCSSKTLTTVTTITSDLSNYYISIFCIASDDCKIFYQTQATTSPPFGGTRSLMMADCDNATCSSKTITTISTSVLTDVTSTASSLFCIASDDCKIAYQTTVGITQYLMMADCDNATCSSNTLTEISSDLVVGFPSIYCITSTDCKIVYQGANGSGDRYPIMADCDNATCSSKTLTIVDDSTSTLTGYYNSIYCVTATDCKIAYQATVSSNNVLVLADCDNATCSSKTLTTIDSTSSTDTGYYPSIYCLSSTDCKIAYNNSDDDGLELMMVDCDTAACGTRTLSVVVEAVATAYVENDTSSLYCLSSTDCKIAYQNSNGDTGEYTLTMADCDTTTCESGVRTVVLGSDSEATNDLSAASSIITFRDNGTVNTIWDSGEDLYLDVDSSLLYNADTLDAITLVNTGTALVTTDITTLKLWKDDGSSSFSASLDTSLDSDCAFNATSSNWECDVATQITSASRIFISADLASAATSGATLIFRVPAKSDVNSNGSFSTNDQGIYFASDHDGPSSALTNSNTLTITAAEVVSSPVSASTTTGAVNATPMQGGEAHAKKGGVLVSVSIPSGALSSSAIITASTPTEFVAKESTKNLLSTQTLVEGTIFDYNASPSAGVATVNPDTLNVFKVPVTISITPARAVEDYSNTAIHYYNEDTNTWIPLATTYNSATHTFSAGTTHFTLFALVRTQEDTAATLLADGDLITTTDSPDIYIVKIEGNNQYKRLILNPQIFDSYGHLRWDAVKQVSQQQLDAFTTSTLVIEVNADGTPTTGKVYTLTAEVNADAGIKRWLDMAPERFSALGYIWESLFRMNHNEAAETFYPEGLPIH